MPAMDLPSERHVQHALSWLAFRFLRETKSFPSMIRWVYHMCMLSSAYRQDPKTMLHQTSAYAVCGWCSWLLAAARGYCHWYRCTQMTVREIVAENRCQFQLVSRGSSNLGNYLRVRDVDFSLLALNPDTTENRKLVYAIQVFWCILFGE